MPELPDLEVFSHNLDRQLKGKKLVKLIINKRAKVQPSATKIRKALEGSKITKVSREGKELRFTFNNKVVLGVHFMLRGRFAWPGEGSEVRHKLAEFQFTREQLILTDYQYNARLTLNPPISDVPDALSPQANLKFWKETLRSRARLKNILLDQKSVRGIGNAYAGEILWDARIDPMSVSNKIPESAIRGLARSVRKVLKAAEKQVKHAEPGIIGGEVRDFLLVHNHKKKTSPTGSKILSSRAGGRKTYFTKEQQLFK